MSATICHDAIQLLSQHRLTPEVILIELEKTPVITLQDEHSSSWSFVKRNHSRRHLMAKTNHMSHYVEIYSSKH